MREGKQKEEVMVEVIIQRSKGEGRRMELEVVEVRRIDYVSHWSENGCIRNKKFVPAMNIPGHDQRFKIKGLVGTF
jgi:hypothetical protein